MTIQDFKAFGLADTLLTALARLDITQPTPIQSQAIPAVLDGRDVLGIAQTGTGKTAAFSLPVIDALLNSGGRAAPKSARVLILTPTRELASQIADSVKSYTVGTKLTHTVVFGGVSIRPQITTLARGIDIVIATPGRLLDLINQRAVSLSSVRHVVLDEADRMLDMGFVRDVMKIVGYLPKERQSLLFSATMPKSIEDLAAKILTKPVRVEVTPEVVTVEKIAQSVYMVPQKAKKHWLIDHLAKPEYSKVVIFTRTKHGANRLSEDLAKAGIESLAIHGNKSQAARQKALASFHKGAVKVLVATDIVARGIHVDDISHVVNFELPEEPESYVHRIGRTARAGRSGIAVSLIDPSERSKLKTIERLTRQTFDIEKTDYVSTGDIEAADRQAPRGARPNRGGGRPSARKPGSGVQGQRRPGGNAGEGQAHAGKPDGQARGRRRRSGAGKPRFAAV
ncbi:DEAD/DEAH box helicase [Aurantimonas sp. VKM B-3413]|uniref:DEAD/DEAH box helicase n=1 Tax=Aurantimonas sp. VKM B-3413 TaxID=2779401 RepID=UPI001E4E37FB|nr:DEAD/DEAH box helicase [Aurantimonas sp. VKM B-3413]MCB8838118.1 DEAD/DEAH box helicase [Aurantimonas sp. VKM B-3413]